MVLKSDRIWPAVSMLPKYFLTVEGVPDEPPAPVTPPVPDGAVPPVPSSGPGLSPTPNLPSADAASAPMVPPEPGVPPDPGVPPTPGAPPMAGAPPVSTTPPEPGAPPVPGFPPEPGSPPVPFFAAESAGCELEQASQPTLTATATMPVIQLQLDQSDDERIVLPPNCSDEPTEMDSAGDGLSIDAILIATTLQNSSLVEQWRGHCVSVLREMDLLN